MGRQGLLGHGQGMPGVGGHDGGAELEAVGHHPGDGEGRQAIEAPGDVRNPTGHEAGRLRRLGLGLQGGHRRALAVGVTDEDPDVHHHEGRPAGDGGGPPTARTRWLRPRRSTTKRP